MLSNASIMESQNVFWVLFSTRAYGRRKLNDLVRQFGLRYPNVDHLTEYLADQVRNRHAHSIRRSSEAAHPFLVERIKRESKIVKFPASVRACGE